MGLILGANILDERPALQSKLIEVPELGGSAYVRELTGAEKGAWMKASEGTVRPDGAIIDGERLNRLDALIVAMGWVDEEGRNVVDRLDRQAMAKLQNLSTRALERMADEIRELSGLNRTALDDAEKN